MKSIMLIIIIILIFFSGCSNPKPPETVIIESSYLPSQDSVLIFTPESYPKDNSYPLVILLHGWSGNYKQWNSIVHLQDFSDTYNFIIACPDGFYDSWYLNNPLKPSTQYEDFFWNDFIPYLTNNYFIDSSNIFISGLSMGGHGAITTFLKNPDFFNSAASTSGILDLTYFPDRWSIKEGIGSIKDYPEVWKNNSAYYLLDSMVHNNKKLFIDCGTSDFAYQVNINFVTRALEYGLDVEFISIPGSHNSQHWNKMIYKHFEFFYNQLQ